MSRRLDLTNAQRRHLKLVVERLVQETTDRLEYWDQVGMPGPAGRRARAELAGLLEAVSRAADELGFSNQPDAPDPGRRLAAWSASWWSHVLDARPTALRRYGELDPEAEATIGPIVADLAERLQRLKALSEHVSGDEAADG